MGLLSSISNIAKPIGNIVSGVGSVVDAIGGNNNAKQNVAYQKEFAQNQLQWRLADARAAGIEPHKAYLLGYTGNSFQNVGYHGSGLSEMGQSISNASDNVQVSDEFQEESARLSLQSQMLENQSKALEVEKQWRELKNMGQTPAFKGLNPFAQPSSAPVSIGNGQAVSNSVVGADNVRLGYGFDSPIPAYSFQPRPDGTIEVLPSKDRMDWASESTGFLPAGIVEGIRQFADMESIREQMERHFKRPVYIGRGIFGQPRFSFERPTIGRPIRDKGKWFWE